MATLHKGDDDDDDDDNNNSNNNNNNNNIDIPGTIERDKYKVATLISWTLIVGYPKECCRT